MHHETFGITEGRLKDMYKHLSDEDHTRHPRKQTRKVRPMDPGDEWAYYRLFFWSDSNGRRILSDEGRESNHSDNVNKKRKNRRDVTLDHMVVIRSALIKLGVCGEEAPTVTDAASWIALLNHALEKFPSASDSSASGDADSSGAADLDNSSDALAELSERSDETGTNDQPSQTSSHRRTIPIALPYPSLGHLFKGRGAFLTQLNASIARDQVRAAITSRAIHGLGGNGKTRTVVEYAWQHRDSYTALLFAVADGPDALLRNLASLSAPLALNLPERDEQDEAIRLKSVIDWLNKHAGWLLILDSVDTPDALAAVDSVIAHLMAGTILITSRMSNFAGHFETLELDVLSLDAAVAFLLERTERQRMITDDDLAESTRLAMDLGGLALALEQSAAYIVRHRESFRGYRRQWKVNWERVARWSDPTVTKYPRAVAATWHTSIQQVGHLSQSLLNRLSWLAAEPLPQFFFEAPDIASASESRNDALTELVAHSLVRQQANPEAVTIHQLVSEATRLNLNHAEASTSLTEAIDWMIAVFDRVDRVGLIGWLRSGPLIAHARSAVQHGLNFRLLAQTAKLVSRIGHLHLNRSQYEDASRMLKFALLIFDALGEPDDREVGYVVSSLASVSRATNELDEIETLHRRAIAIFERRKDCLALLARELSSLAEFFIHNERFEDAEPLLLRSISIIEEADGYEHIRLADPICNLAFLLRSTGRLEQADVAVARVVALFEGTNPVIDNPSVELSKLADLLRATDRLEESEFYLRAALTISEKIFGQEDHNHGDILRRLASLLVDMGRDNEAVPVYRRALACLEERFGNADPELANELIGLARCLLRLGGESEAEALLHRTVNISERAFGEKTTQYALSLSNLAGLYFQTKRNVEAEKAFRRAFEIYDAAADPDSYPRLDDFHTFASILLASGRAQEAEEPCLRALSLKLARSGEDLGVVDYYRVLGAVYCENGKLEEAVAALRHAALIEANEGSSNWETAATLSLLGEALRRQDRPDEAIQCLEQALAIFDGEEEIAGDSRIAGVRIALADLYRTHPELATRGDSDSPSCA